MALQYSRIDIKEAATAAARLLGYREMKYRQLQAVESYLNGHDVFGVLPTGFGKSLCFACLPLVFDKLLRKPQGYSIVLVVSPLVAIMKDQVITCSCIIIIYMYVYIYIYTCI